MARFLSIFATFCLLYTMLGLPTLHAEETWRQPQAPMCIERWISDTARRLNTYAGTAEFNSRKPWSINRFGLFVGNGIRSNYEPDSWALFSANKYHWMWGNYRTEDPNPLWNNPNFTRAGVRGLRAFVRACLDRAGAGATGNQTTPPNAGQTMPPVCPPASSGTCPVIPASSSARCPSSFSSFSQSEIVLGCFCDPSAINGSVWGTDVYTADSSICAAARHVGAIGPQGGVVWVQGAPGQASYAGTSRNGITTSNYGSYQGSMRFPSVSTGPVLRSPEACPSTAKAMRGQIGKRLTCHCAPDKMSGNVWGSGTYTDDSSICRAALHDGAIGRNGGKVTIVVVRGQSGYTASNNNGVSTSKYGAWDGSFRFSH